jgi:CRISPR-associated protein Csb2
MFAFGIDFITGMAVMTDPSSRENAEWPPHPARVFMALVAAHYETKPLPDDGTVAAAAWQRQRSALEWLESLGAPMMAWPAESRRDIVKVYVPVNDAGVPGKPGGVKQSELRSALGVMPDCRSRQERTFPAVYVNGDDARRLVFLNWPDAVPVPECRNALETLASAVTRIGHSSSLVRMWVCEGEVPSTYQPAATKGKAVKGIPLRVPAAGFLAELDQRYNAEDIDAFFELSEAIAARTGKAKEQAKAAFEERFGMAWSRTASAPVRQRPSTGRTVTYVPICNAEPQIVQSIFDSELLVLTKQDGPTLGLEASAALTSALRGLLLKNSEGLPAWFTGHNTQGGPSTGGHMAILPLAYVGAEHADGHIMGLALAFPRSVSDAERAACLRGRIFGPSGEDLDLKLVMGSIGEWTLRREERSVPPIALRSLSWNEPSTVWASVTPVVLDRHPKRDYRDERAAWRDEVAALIAKSCEQQKLPKPVSIDVDKTSWHRGAPRSRPGPNGMPWLPTKDGAAQRQQVHVLIEFPCEVEGPLLLGAGRFRGYGMCKPLGFSK